MRRLHLVLGAGAVVWALLLQRQLDTFGMFEDDHVGRNAQSELGEARMNFLAAGSAYREDHSNAGPGSRLLLSCVGSGVARYLFMADTAAHCISWRRLGTFLDLRNRSTAEL